MADDTKSEIIATLEQAHAPIQGTRLAGRHALISGAGSAGPLLGTGAAIATLFAAQGATVTILDRDRERGNTTIGLIEAVGSRGQLIEADITDTQQCRDAIESAHARFGRLDTLVNNAGIARPDDIRSIPEADIDATLAINLKAPMILSQAASAALSEHRGSIINIGSISGHRGFGLPAYAATKAALGGLTRDMAVSLGSSGIRVNCISPGAINTPMGGRSEEAREAIRLATLIGVEGTAWDIAFAALFLASDEGRWITGVDLVVDAGMTIAGRSASVPLDAVTPKRRD